MATKRLLAELRQDYAARTGHAVHIESVGGVDASRRVREGEAFDAIVVAREVVEQLTASGHVLPGSRIDLAHSPLAVAVPAHAPKLDVGSEHALREAVLKARAICITTGPSRAPLLALLERWAIREQVAGRIVTPPPSVPVGRVLEAGEADIGFQQLSELRGHGGIAIAGLMPPEIAIVTTFSAGICRTSTRTDDTRALLNYLASRDASAAIRRHDMEPA